jgi:CheY-like chemotaxis protein
MIEPQAQQSGISIRFVESCSPTHVRADSTRLKQILVNLLSNAIKYNRPGGSVIVECSRSPSERIRVSVRDTGAGLPPDMLQLLFKPFNRLGRERSTVEGTGIGLVMSKRVVELMGGAIGVQSTVGVGSVFWFELDSATAPELDEAIALPAAAAPADSRRDGPPRTLLYIEDNPANLKLVERLIARRPDLRLLSATDGIVGVATARNAQPALILMDINLPGISGFEALALLRADPATEHIPVVAVSANAMPRDIEEGLGAGFFRYLTKPIQVDQFMETLDLALEHAEHETARSA